MNRRRFLTCFNLILSFCAFNAFGNAANSPPDNSAVPKGWTITPSMLTPVGSGASSTSTPGLTYSYKKDVIDDATGRLVECDSACSGFLTGPYGKFTSTGKIAADPSVNVGDELDLDGLLGIEGIDGAPKDKMKGIYVTGLKGAVEYGQRFATKHYTYGLNLLAHLYPGDPKQSSMSNTWPFVVLDWQRVDPATDTVRKAVDPTLSDYNRAHFGLTTTSDLDKITIRSRPLKFDFAFDHWREISPSAAIVAADLNRQTYRQFQFRALGTGNDPDYVISYGSGDVPTDQSGAKVIKLGLSYNFK